MLQQILRDLYVDPEILAELDEQQKQTLFCKMREEQVRRWKIWNESDEQLIKKSPKPERKKQTRKTVRFLSGIDGEPWVWVMGEHENDKTIEEILAEETREKARELAEKETKELRKQVEETLSEYIDLTTTTTTTKKMPKIEELDINEKNLKIDDMDIYCSVDELRDKININKPNNININNINNKNSYSINHYQNKNKFNLIDTSTNRDVLQEITINNKVAQRVALWEKRLTEERTCEILKTIQKKQMETDREAEEAERKQELLWIEQGN